MEQPVVNPAALDAQIDAAAQAARTEISTVIDRPEGEPTHLAKSPFDERAFWVSEGLTVRVWSVRGVAVERVDITGSDALRRRLPVPAFGSPELRAWLAKSDFFVIPAENGAPGAPGRDLDGASWPWGAGLLFSRRRGEQPGGMFWLGPLDRSSLPSITLRMLDFERAEVWTVGLRGKLVLVDWPRCLYRGHDLDIRGAWHDWKLVLGARPAGVWTYATLSEQLDFVAGDVATWLEILAHDEALRAEKRLPIEIGFLLGRAPRTARGEAPMTAGRHLAGALGLAEDPARTGPAHESFEGERVWLRALSPPMGRPFAVARCATPEDAVRTVEHALAAGIPLSRAAREPRLPRVAVSSWSPDPAALRAEIAARGCEVLSSAAMWWGELGAGR